MDANAIAAVILAAAAVIGGIYASIRGLVRFTQYLAKKESAQERQAQVFEDLAADLSSYIQNSDARFIRIETHLGTHDADIAVLRDRVTRNGHLGSPASGHA